MAHEDETSRFLAAWMQVRQMVQAANFNRFQRAGLSATQFMTLNTVPEQGMTLSELARRLNLSAATLNETVNSLEERGLVRRSRDLHDARKVNICATPEGQEMQNAASQEFHGFMAGLFGRMSRTRREGLLTGLEAMVRLHAEMPATSQSGNAASSGPTPRDAGAPPAKRSSPRSPRPSAR